jgi:hypothetical protein
MAVLPGHASREIPRRTTDGKRMPENAPARSRWAEVVLAGTALAILISLVVLT